MPSIPKKVEDRIVAGIKHFQPILQSAHSRDVNESDTVIIVTDLLSDVFGFDKYSEITSESAIRGTYCDLATKVDGIIQSLIEVKAIGQDLKDSFVKQAVDYAANKGVDWVILTNGVLWRIYKVLFSKPIEQELLCEINLLSSAPREQESLDLLFLLTKEAWVKSILGDYYNQKQALSRFCLAAMVLSDPVLALIRREIRRLSPDVKIDTDQIKNALEQEVIKRDVVEGEKADDARKKIKKSLAKQKKDAGEGAETPLDANACNQTVLPPNVPLGQQQATTPPKP